MGTIRLAGIVDESFTDGVGIRYTIFTQGCDHKCHNCQNPETWDFAGGKNYDIDKIIEDIKENPLLDGITLSGGDPMYQTSEVLELAKKIKADTDLNIWLYTGFYYDECVQDKNKLEVLKYIDILVDGVYDEHFKTMNLKFRGSSNQRVIDVKKSLDNNQIVLYMTD